MRLKNLLIASENPAEQIRSVNFNPEGLSLIVDLDSEEGKSGNNIGKSTFAKIIDLCLGADNVKMLYHDVETKDDALIKCHLNEAKIYAVLTVEEASGKTHRLRRNLWEGGKYAFDGSPIEKKDEYRGRIKSIAFPDASKAITLRQIMPFFLRLESTQNFLFEYLGTYHKPIEYRQFYDYLIGANSTSELVDLSKEIKKKKEENARILRRNGIRKISQIDVLISKAKQEADAKEKELKSDDVVLNFLHDESNSALQSNLESKTQKVTDTEGEISFMEDKIAQERANIEKIDEESLKNLYEDGRMFIRDLNKDFRQFVDFHEQMTRKRLEGFQARIEILKKRLTKEKEDLDEARRAYSGKFVDYKFDLNGKENERLSEVVELASRLKSLLADKTRYEANENDIAGKEDELNAILSEKKNLEQKQEALNTIFKAVTMRVFDKPFELEFTSGADEFPITCSGGNKGAGDRKTVVACFVFSLMKLYGTDDRDMPSFFVQDQMEGVSLKNLSQLEIESVNAHCQYVIPILKDRARDLGALDGKQVLVLSQNNKLFKI